MTRLATLTLLALAVRYLRQVRDRLDAAENQRQRAGLASHVTITTAPGLPELNPLLWPKHIRDVA